MDYVYLKHYSLKKHRPGRWLNTSVFDKWGYKADSWCCPQIPNKNPRASANWNPLYSSRVYNLLVQQSVQWTAVWALWAGVHPTLINTTVRINECASQHAHVSPLQQKCVRPGRLSWQGDPDSKCVTPSHSQGSGNKVVGGSPKPSQIK